MTDEATEDNDSDFFEIAVAHGLLDRERASEINDHASQNGMHPSDAALSLSAMKPWEVDATRLLMNAKDLAPGFELNGLIGCGAAGMVFRAHQSALNRDVALKTINILGRGSGKTGESRIQQEAQAIARLQHPNIVTAYDSGFYKGRFCIAMELVEGETLADFIAREAPVPEEVAWQIARQAAAALCHADSAGIIHRDIKPANLLLCSPPAGVNLPPGVPFVKVVDFGLALDESHEGDDRLTVTGATLGTPAYVAPEQLENSSVDCRADIYSLGATVFHMLTGDAPFSDQSPMKAILQKTIGDTSWRDVLPASVSETTTALLRSMTEADVEERIGDYKTLITRIDDLLNGAVHENETKDSLAPKAAPTRSHRSTLFLGIVTFCAVMAAIAASGILSDGGATPKPSPASTVEWVPAGQSTALFNGRSVPFRLLATGKWMPVADPDLAGILMGTERSALTIPLNSKPLDPQNGSPHARLLVNVFLPDQSAQVDVELEQTSPGGEAATIGTLRISDGHADYFTGSDVTIEAVGTFSYAKVDPADVVPRAVEVRRDGNRIRMIIQGSQAAEIEADDKDTFSVTFRSVSGGVGLSDMTIVELIPEKK